MGELTLATEKAAHRIMGAEELSLPLTLFSTKEDRPCTLPVQHSRVVPAGRGMGELTPQLLCHEVAWAQGEDLWPLSPHHLRQLGKLSQEIG